MKTIKKGDAVKRVADGAAREAVRQGGAIVQNMKPSMPPSWLDSRLPASHWPGGPHEQ